jgi:transcription termination/antitermination protein NusG
MVLYNLITKQKWYVLYTKPNFEKKVELQFKDFAIESFLPLYTVIRTWSDRKKKVEVPLFPGYIFVYGDEKTRLMSLTVNGVVKSVMFKNDPATLRDFEIDNIKRVLKSNKIIETVSSITIGVNVKIKTGPLEGLEGRLVEIKGNKVFSLVLETINSSILVDIPQEDVVVV